MNKIINNRLTVRQTDELIKEIKDEMSNISLDEAAFTRMKKVWIANEVKMIDDIDSTVHNIYDDSIIHYRRIKVKNIISHK